MSLTYPDPVLEIRTTVVRPVAAQGFCIGFEGGQWRCSTLAKHIFQWLPYVALTRQQREQFGPHNWVEMATIACKHIYDTCKTESRGEIGEVLFHLICILHYGTLPLVCKLVLKTSPNDVVKGFDGVHLVASSTDFEIWLGESKFYTEGKRAIADAIESVNAHLLPSFLSTEKAMLVGHLPSDVPHYKTIAPLFRQSTSADVLLNKAVFPILIAYESSAAAIHTSVCKEYMRDLNAEVTELVRYTQARTAHWRIRYHVIFVPIKSKADLVADFDARVGAFR